MYNREFSEHKGKGEDNYSLEDKRFLKLMQDEGVLKDGHYELPLPFRKKDINLPNNRCQAVQRAEWLKKRMQKDEKLLKDYKEFMGDLMRKGQATKVVKTAKEGKEWYIPHFCVYQPSKPDKARVVFDCSATFKGISLNSCLLQGPDLTNTLVGVLTRFRHEKVAVMADIEKMFYQVRVPEEQRDYLKFVWWPDGNIELPLEDYQMCVHIFGGFIIFKLLKLCYQQISRRQRGEIW